MLYLNKGLKNLQNILKRNNINESRKIQVEQCNGRFKNDCIKPTCYFLQIYLYHFKVSKKAFKNSYLLYEYGMYHISHERKSLAT